MVLFLIENHSKDKICPFFSANANVPCLALCRLFKTLFFVRYFVRHFHSYLIVGLTKANYVEMTDIQRFSLGKALKGCDILGAAKTGSGKTLAFLIPVRSTILYSFTFYILLSVSPDFLVDLTSYSSLSRGSMF
jgi:superfamily II DNA/RNA helicase